MPPLQKPSLGARDSMRVPHLRGGSRAERVHTGAFPSLVAAFIGLFVLVGCREDDSASPVGVDEARSIRIHVERGTLPDSTWRLTDSVVLVVATTDGLRILDDVVGFVSGTPGIQPLQAPVDRAVVVEAWGLRTGIGIWRAKVSLPPSTTSQVANLMAESTAEPSAASPSPGESSAQNTSLQVSGATFSEAPWLGSDTFDRPVTVKLSASIPNAEIRYTLDGTVPTRTSSLYDASSGVPIDSSRTLKAAVFDVDHLGGDSIWSRDIVLMSRPVRITYREGIASFGASLSCATTGVSIRYRLDGSVPAATDSLFRDSLVFGRFDDSVEIVAVATPSNPMIQPSTPVRKKIGMELPWNDDISYGTIRDERDGRIYRTVVVAGKRWMAQNLDYRTDGSWCYGGASDGCLRYGRLYTWVEAMGLSRTFDTTSWASNLPRQGVCPKGWHLPSDAEWADLANVSMNGALKSTRGWFPGGGQDRYGFRILPAGRRYDGDNYVYAGSSAYFWSASGHDGFSALGSYQCSGCDHLYRSDFRKNYGMAIRCAED